MSEEKKPFDYPIGFMNEIDLATKNKLLKQLIDCMFDDVIDVKSIPIPHLKNIFVELLVEANEAATIMEAKLEMAGKAAVKDLRAARKKKSVAERAKALGLTVLTPNVPTGKLILE